MLFRLCSSPACDAIPLRENKGQPSKRPAFIFEKERAHKRLESVRGSFMDASRAISEFVKSGRILFALLRSEGANLSKLDLHLLRTQLFILQVEVHCLDPLRLGDRNAKFAREEEDGDAMAKIAPSISAMAAYLKVGDRLQARRDHYPARSGAIGCIRCFKGMPENWYVVLEWEKPLKNFSGEKLTNVWPIGLEYFEVVQRSHGS
jgi:hypothetical protein